MKKKAVKSEETESANIQRYTKILSADRRKTITVSEE